VLATLLAALLAVVLAGWRPAAGALAGLPDGEP
jgi:hypothetical protein